MHVFSAPISSASSSSSPSSSVWQRHLLRCIPLACGLAVLVGCGGGGGGGDAAGAGASAATDGAQVSDASGSTGGGTGGTGTGSTGGGTSGSSPAAQPVVAPTPTVATPVQGTTTVGNPDGHAAVPASAQAVALNNPRVVGTGTPASCTGEAVANAVAQGGHIAFNCGADPVTITMTRTAKVFNNRPDVVLDGGGKVTLSGGGRVRILYQNTCDEAQVWTSAACDQQASPQLTVQNIAFVDGKSAGQGYGLSEVYGGGAVYVRGGALRVVNSRFSRNQCESMGSDMGGGAVRVFGASTFINQSSFGGSVAADGNHCANGGAVSGLVSSVNIYNSTFNFNRALGTGASNGSGGNGGAIYMDGNTINLTMSGSRLDNNQANEGGSAVFFVSNDRSGTVSLLNSIFSHHDFGKFETNSALWPGLYIDTRQVVTTGSTFSR